MSDTYSYAQLEGLWINAGGPSAVAPIAAAVALAESGGDPSALNPNDNGGTQTSVGLWQVSNGTHEYPSDWTTASGNATEAVAKYTGAGNSFSPWGTYTSGAYNSFLQTGVTPDTTVSTPSGNSTTGGTTTGTATPDPGCLIGGGSIDLLVTSVPIPCFFEKSWLRAIAGAGLLGLGGLVSMFAVVILMKNLGADFNGPKMPGALGTAQQKAYNARIGTASNPSIEPAPIPSPEGAVKEEKQQTPVADALAQLRARGNELAPRQNPSGGNAGGAVKSATKSAAKSAAKSEIKMTLSQALKKIPIAVAE
jgi:hypothetical protein